MGVPKHVLDRWKAEDKARGRGGEMGWFLRAMSARGDSKPVPLAGPQVQPAIIDEAEEANHRLIERINRAIDILTFGLQELIDVDRWSSQQPNPAAVLASTRTLCDLIDRPAPQLSFERRRPGRAPPRLDLCINCGNKLGRNERQICVVCEGDEAERTVKQTNMDAAREQRDAKDTLIKQLNRDIRGLASDIGKVKRKVKHARHARHSGQDDQNLEAGR